jgi:hypothetical protein
MPGDRAARTLTVMTASAQIDAAGRRRSPATMPGHHCGRPPRNKGLRYPADPPTVEELVATGPARQGRQAPRGRYGPLGVGANRAVAGLPRHPSRRRSAVRHRWRDRRPTVVALGRPHHAEAPRGGGGRAAPHRPHQLRHAHAVEMAREDVPLNVIQRQLGRREPWHHVDLPPGHRQQRDHQYRSHAAGADATRDRALSSFIRYFNRWRPHSAAGGRPPITRVQHLRRQDK